MDIGVVGKDLLGDFSLELAVGALDDFDQIEVLDRVVVRVELEAAAQRGEVGFLHRCPQRVFVGTVAFRQLERAVYQERGIVGLECVGRRDRAEFFSYSATNFLFCGLSRFGAQLTPPKKPIAASCWAGSVDSSTVNADRNTVVSASPAWRNCLTKLIPMPPGRNT